MSKTVVITGGSGDIAIAIADEIKNVFNDYQVFLPTRQELDVTDLQKVNDYFSQKNVDILINNAGAILLEDISKNNIITHKQVIDVNLTGVFACTGIVLANNPNAKIINVGSSAGTKVHGSWSSYCATKSAVIMATACWAEEGVDVVCISPGRTATKMRKSMYPDEDVRTLLLPHQFAKYVVKKIKNNDYQKGINIDVNINNIEELLNE